MPRPARTLPRIDAALAAFADGALTVAAAVEFSGLARTHLYEAMGRGELETRKCGKRRLISRESLRAYLAGGRGGVRLYGGTT